MIIIWIIVIIGKIFKKDLYEKSVANFNVFVSY